MLNLLTEIFKSFQDHELEYMVIGGIASILYGVPRTTFDLDILIRPTGENAKRLLDALLKAGLGTATLTDVDGILSHDISVFKDRVRIDVQTSTPGIAFEEAWKRRVTMNYQGQDFLILSKADLIASKKAAGKPVDLEDVRLLEFEEDENSS